MYHEEQVINGILHWRGTPTGAFIPYSAAQLTERLLEAERVRHILRNEIDCRDLESLP